MLGSLFAGDTQQRSLNNRQNDPDVQTYKYYLSRWCKHRCGSSHDTIEPIANLAKPIIAIRTNKANVDAANQTTTQMDTGQYTNSWSVFATRTHAITFTKL